MTANSGESGPLAELLRQHRAAVRISQRELARLCGLSERAVRDLERGATARPRRHSLLAIADALNLFDADRRVFLAAGRDTGPSGGAPAYVMPNQPGALVGRTRELALVTDLVAGGRHRIVTVTGAGGVGKSCLAAEVVAVLRRGGADARTLDLSTLTDPGLVPDLITDLFDAGGGSRLSAVDRMAAALRDRRVVLLLDGFERLLPAASTVAALVRRCPGLTVLVTSQQRVRLAGERQVRLAPLSEEAAVELLVRRARAVRPDLAVAPEAAAAICRRVDNLPLAVELAAAQLRLLTPAELAARLARPLRLLTGGAVDVPARHRSLRATIEASLDLVGDDSRTLYAWLGAWPAGAALDDLETVSEALRTPAGWLTGAVGGLVDASLVQVRDRHGRTRYVLPDAMRELAGERLAGRTDSGVVRRAVAVHFMNRLRSPDGRGPDPYAVLDDDAGNLRAALAWARDNDTGLVDLPVIHTLYRYHEVRGRLTEGRDTLVALAAAGVPGAAWATLRAAQLSQSAGRLDDAADLVAAAQRLLPADDTHARATAWLLAGRLAAMRGDLRAAADLTTLALDAGRAGTDHDLVGRALNNLAAISHEAGDNPRALRLWRDALDAKERAGAGEVDIGRTMMNLAEGLLATYDRAAAAAFARRAAGLLERGGHPRLRANALTVLALATLDQNPTAAQETMARAVALLAEFGDDRPLYGLVLARYSVVLHARGRTDQISAALHDGVAAMCGGHTRHEVPPIVEAHAALLAGRQPAGAARLLGLALAVRERTDGNPPALLRPATETMRECRDRLGPARLQANLDHGGRLYPLGVVDALDVLAAEAPPGACRVA